MEGDATAPATYTADQFAPLFAAEDRHFWFRSRNRCIAAALRALPDLAAIRAVLEVGCGTGVVLAELARVFPAGHVVGMDLFAEGLAFARKRFPGTLIQGDVFRHEFAQSFDLIGAFDVIEHLDDDAGLLQRLGQQLRPGGYLVVTVPGHPGLWSYFDEVAHHRRRYTRPELERKLAAAGFEPVYLTWFMSALFLPMWLKRRLVGGRLRPLAQASAGARQMAVESDLKINPVANWLLETALRPEAVLIRRGLRLPLGTSLLAIARRPAGPAVVPVP